MTFVPTDGAGWFIVFTTDKLASVVIVVTTALELLAILKSVRPTGSVTAAVLVMEGCVVEGLIRPFTVIKI
ncbi:hypothetical protein D3C86_2001310 [compost metagenome]